MQNFDAKFCVRCGCHAKLLGGMLFLFCVHPVEIIVNLLMNRKISGKTQISYCTMVSFLFPHLVLF